jgi:pimeloyl-ACP methyl ester carboxylesterase
MSRGMGRANRGARGLRLSLAAAVAATLAGGCASMERKFVYPGAASQGQAAVAAAPDYELVPLELRDGTHCIGQFGAALDASGHRLPNTEDRPTLIFFYGNGMCLARSAGEFNAFRQLGANVFIPEFPGYGMSGGQPNENGFYALADAAFEHVCQRREVDARRVVVCGWSLGAALAIHLASRNDVKGLVTISAFTTLPEVEHATMPWLPISWFLRPRFDNLSRMPNVTCPVLLVHGGRDKLVPVEMAERLAGQAKTRARVYRVPEAGHNDIFATGGAQLTAELQAFIAPAKRRPSP